MATSPAEILFRNNLAPGSRILDVGCGTGRHAHELAAAGFRVVAMDLDFDAVETAKELQEPGEGESPLFLAARAEALPFRPGMFPAVLCVDVLHWADDAVHFESMWRGAWDAVEAGGIFLVRSLLGDRIPSAQSLPDGKHRLESGAEWFLPRLAVIQGLLDPSGKNSPEVFPAAQEGSAWILSRKPG